MLAYEKISNILSVFYRADSFSAKTRKERKKKKMKFHRLASFIPVKDSRKKARTSNSYAVFFFSILLVLSILSLRRIMTGARARIRTILARIRVKKRFSCCFFSSGRDLNFKSRKESPIRHSLYAFLMENETRKTPTEFSFIRGAHLDFASEDFRAFTTFKS